MILTIDGASGTGKSSVAKEVAKSLGFSFFDTGAMYRLAAYQVLLEKVPIEEEEKVEKALLQFHLDIRTSSHGERKYFLKGKDCTQEIRLPEVSNASSKIAKYPSVRAKMVQIQREFGQKQNTVFEGRDMGTVVFPEADLKIFLTADLEVRAKRRFEELLQKFPDSLFCQETIFREMKDRDESDSQRKYSPLKKAKDAVEIDTSKLTLQEVVQKVLKAFDEKKKRKPKKRFFYAFCIACTKLVFFLLYRYKVYGKKHFINGPAILASNHQSFLDPSLVAISAPEEIHFLAKQSLFRVFFLKTLIRSLNTHPVSKNAANAATFRLILQLLMVGKKVLLFPEGARSYSEKLQPLQEGVAILAYKAKCPIIPIYLQGTHQVWKRGQRFPKLWGKVICVFGSPLYWEESLQKEKKQAIFSMMKKLDHSLHALEKWAKGNKTKLPP